MILDHLAAVDVNKAYRLFNLGATPLVAAESRGDMDIMPATWCCPLDLNPTKVTAVIDHTHYTRRLIEESGRFALMIPTVSIVEQVLKLGWASKNDEPDKVEKSGAELFYVGGGDMPFVKGCAAWAIFDVIPEEHNQTTYDLFIGRCAEAWADDRLFKDGHWLLEHAPLESRPLHYVAGGHWYATGEAVTLPQYGNE